MFSMCCIYKICRFHCTRSDGEHLCKQPLLTMVNSLDVPDSLIKLYLCILFKCILENICISNLVSLFFFTKFM